MNKHTDAQTHARLHTTTLIAKGARKGSAKVEQKFRAWLGTKNAGSIMELARRGND